MSIAPVPTPTVLCTEVDRDAIPAWQSWRGLVTIRWPKEHGFGEMPTEEFPEVIVLQSHM